MKSNIALIGFMATGKTTIGRMLAERLNKNFIELDKLIEEKAGKPIPKIFSEDGEIRFRELEMSVCKEMSNKTDLVISTGGGVILNKLNIDYLKISSEIILLEASPEEILGRIMKEGKEKRPMIDKPDPKGEMMKLLEFRAPFYAAATNLKITTTGKSIGQIVDDILNIIPK
jgi:shikimate kinase